MIKVSVQILPKKEVLDAPARSVLRAIQKNGKTNLNDLSIGKHLILSFKLKDKKKAVLEAEKLCKNFLVNPLVEQYKIEIL